MNNQDISPNSESAIGVFDSGIGGLTVVKALMERLPHENIIYFGDTARVPYGVKSKKTIQLFTQQITEFLLQKNVKALVVACNTISAVALNTVKKLAHNIPVIDVISAGASEALKVTNNNQIGVIATSTTVNSNAYARAIANYNINARVISKACSLLVPLIEEGWLNNEITRLTVREYLKPVLAENIDTLILGCTHYPLLKPMIQTEVGSDISLIDSAITVAKTIANELEQKKLLNHDDSLPDYQFYVSDIPLKFQTIGEQFLGRTLEHIERQILG
ncbi:glutamate racemase [Neisseriaceae bacterium PsAf]|nr:glutamate racemase [Neisseriaceae bacterium PsAf]